MGSNVSTVSKRKAPAVTPVHGAQNHAYNRSAGHRWTTEPPVKDESLTTGEPKMARNYKRHTSGHVIDQSNEIEIIRPATFPNHSANTNRVISFHSSACWRDFFRASKHSDKLIVIFFSATWCGYCRYMEPILNDLAAQYTDVEFDKLDVDELYDISREFKAHATPTFLFVKRGKEVDKVTGTGQEDIRRKIDIHRA